VIPDTVAIMVDTVTGRVTVSPDPLFIQPGDSVIWFSNDGPWAVHFNPISPLGVRRLRGATGERNGGLVRANILPGKYSYFVAVAVGSSVYTADPGLIDDGEEEGGRPPR
jgi:plastocyanin